MWLNQSLKLPLKTHIKSCLSKSCVCFWTAYWLTPLFRLPWSHLMELIIRTQQGAFSSWTISSLYYTSLFSLCSEAWYWMVLKERVGERLLAEVRQNMAFIQTCHHSSGQRGLLRTITDAERSAMTSSIRVMMCRLRAWENVFLSSALPLLLTTGFHETGKWTFYWKAK